MTRKKFRREVIAILLTLGILVVAIPNGLAAVKAGATCTKKGAIQVVGNKKYTCVLKGKKFVWDSGILIKTSKSGVSALPTPSPSSTAKNVPDAKPSSAATNPPDASPTSSSKPEFIPWATQFDVNDLMDLVIKKSDLYFGKVVPSSKYSITIDPLISIPDKTWITDALNYVSGAFSNIPREEMKVFLGTNHQWSKSTLQSQNLWVGDKNSEYPCSNGVNDAYCADKNIVLLIYSDIYQRPSQYRWDIGRKSTPAHEVFHTVQDALGGLSYQPGDSRKMPRWLVEGSANYFGFYIAQSLEFGNYSEGRRNQVTNNPSYSTVYPLKSYEDWGKAPDGSLLDPYGVGQAATEYIIASVGFENLLNIFRFTKSENSFEFGFKKATGIELSDFYQKFDAAKSSLRIGKN